MKNLINILSSISQFFCERRVVSRGKSPSHMPDSDPVLDSVVGVLDVNNIKRRQEELKRQKVVESQKKKNAINDFQYRITKSRLDIKREVPRSSVKKALSTFDRHTKGSKGLETTKLQNTFDTAVNDIMKRWEQFTRKLEHSYKKGSHMLAKKTMAKGNAMSTMEAEVPFESLLDEAKVNLKNKLTSSLVKDPNFYEATMTKLYVYKKLNLNQSYQAALNSIGKKIIPNGFISTLPKNVLIAINYYNKSQPIALRRTRRKRSR